MLNRPQIAVIGAGVSGLSCGLWLQKAGFSVTIFSKDPHESLVSRKAAAIWLPYQAQPQELIQTLSMETLADFESLTELLPDAGVNMVNVALLFKHLKTREDYAILKLLDSRRLSHQELPQDYACGWEIQVPFIDTSVYMPFLLSRFLDLGGHILHQAIADFAELHDFPMIINCCGLGAVELLGDDQLFPIRGQIVRIPKPSTPLFLIDDTDEDQPGYIFARQNDCVVGGSAQRNQWDQTPDLNLREEILQRCAGMLPGLKDATVLSDEVGLRPGRSQLRLEAEPSQGLSQAHIFHNYGHGGSGFTISWGCARRAVQWVAQVSGIPIAAEMPLITKPTNNSKEI